MLLRTMLDAKHAPSGTNFRRNHLSITKLGIAENTAGHTLYNRNAQKKELNMCRQLRTGGYGNRSFFISQLLVWMRRADM